MISCCRALPRGLTLGHWVSAGVAPAVKITIIILMELVLCTSQSNCHESIQLCCWFSMQHTLWPTVRSCISHVDYVWHVKQATSALWVRNIGSETIRHTLLWPPSLTMSKRALMNARTGWTARYTATTP
jgi:hypothetical protein